MNTTQKNKTAEDQNTLDIRSLDQAEKLITGIEGKPEKKEEICYKIVDSIMRNHSVGKEITGSGDAFHNFSVSIIRCCSDYLTAWEIIQLGRTIHPGNVDLLADALRYGYNCGKKDECKEYYNELKGIDYSRWTSRAFSFAIDYLIYLSTDQGDSYINQTALSVKHELESTIKKFQELFPEDDDSRFREYEMCRFPHEIDEDDEGYFDKGVGFYFFEPVYEKDSYMVLDYNEFYNEVYKAYQKYIGKRPEIKDKVTELLKKLEEKMTAASNDEIEKPENSIKI